MGELAEFRPWEELIPEALGLIFRNLPLKEILSVVPRVCKSWSRAVAGPYCWQEIDLEEWSYRVGPEKIERMLRLLVRRSSGYCRRLAVSGVNDSLLSFIADHAGSLQSLKMPWSEISDAVVELVAGRLCNITFLEISFCKNIGARSLKSFGLHCKSLVGLRRKMNPRTVVCKDDEALAIAFTMPKLRHLDLDGHLLTTQGVLQILSHCQELEFLDITGCWNVKLDDKLMKEKYPELGILGPNYVECSYYSDTSEKNYMDYVDVDDDDDDDDYHLHHHHGLYLDMSD